MIFQPANVIFFDQHRSVSIKENYWLYAVSDGGGGKGCYSHWDYMNLIFNLS